MIQKDQKDIIHIQNILGGNKKSEQYIYFKYKKEIKKIIINKYGKSFDTDDHVSDIIIKIFSNLDKFDNSKSNFNTWIFNIVKNHMNTIHRDIKSKKIYVEEYYSNFSTEYTNVCTTYETNNTLDYISRKISISDFEMLSMKYLDGYNYNEIGKEFNTSSTSACNKINYIKTKLKNNKHLIYD